MAKIRRSLEAYERLKTIKEFIEQESPRASQKIDMKEIKDKIKTIIKKYSPEKIILFGSYATGKSTHFSDVDLLIIMDTERST